MKIVPSVDQLDYLLSRLGPLVPTKPLDPLFGSLRLDVSASYIEGSATDGNMWASCRVPNLDSTSDHGTVLVPAHRLHEMAKAMPGDPHTPVELIVAEDGNSARLVRTGARFSFPLLSLRDGIPEQFQVPTIEGDLEDVGDAQDFADALARAAYSMGQGDSAEARTRMLNLEAGKVSAFSSYGRAQEIRLAGPDSPARMKLPDFAVAPLVRFIRSYSAVKDVHAFIGSARDVVEGNTAVAYSVVVLNRPEETIATFSWPTLVADFVDLGPVWRIADQQAEGAGELYLKDWQGFVDQLRAARLAARADTPVGILQLGSVQLSARTDDGSDFEATVSGTYTGDDPERSIAFSLEDMIDMLTSTLVSTLERSALLLVAAESGAARGGRPMIQLVDSDEDTAPGDGAYRAVIAQTELPR